ncbi:MAG: hypothetical protein H6602_02950 [Flavobacteriales bacterium]|nr:hypothetical protein [Flavobacteriales bacterium]MCB9190605.1 hypothetical protein [Flavobacteriales bacterium]
MSGDFDIVNVVQMVNGERKYGLLLKRKSTTDNPHWEFVAFGNLRSYVRSRDRNLIEQVPMSMIKFVDRVRV